MKKSNTRGPGRPQYQMVIPSGKFTFTDLEVANGVNPKTGKGKRCTTLTLRKNLKKDMYILDKKGEIARTNPNSLVVLLKDILAEPDSKSGLGRKQLVYIRRTQLNRAGKSNGATRKTRKQHTADVAVNVGVSEATQNYEATKAALLAPEPVTAITIAPAPAVAEVAPAVIAPAAPVAETPATPAPVTETAPTAPTATVVTPSIDELINS